MGDSASGLTQVLRLALAESQSECASIQRGLDERLAKENNQTELLCEAADREAVATNAIRESSRWMAERDVLREEIGRLRAETRALRKTRKKSGDNMWANRSVCMPMLSSYNGWSTVAPLMNAHQSTLATTAPRPGLRIER